MDAYKQALTSMEKIIGLYLSCLTRVFAALIEDEERYPERYEELLQQIDSLVQQVPCGSKDQLSEDEKKTLLRIHAGFQDMLDLALRERKNVQ